MQKEKNAFLERPEVKELLHTIASLWNDGLDFHNGTDRYSSIKSAFNEYKWKYSITNEQLPSEIPSSGITFEDSSKALSAMQEKLRTSFAEDDPTGVKDNCRIILKWGGVLGSPSRGNLKYLNNPTLAGNQPVTIIELLKIAGGVWKTAIGELHPVPFRSNAGFTKIYSLAFDDFVIYDSRVAAALTYIIVNTFPGKIPVSMKLFMPPLRQDKSYDISKRNPDPAFFKSVNNNDSKHFYSNVKASWLLSGALDLIQQKEADVTLRKLEAALFMIGYDLRQKR